jgi:TctA family transporter
MIVKGFFYGEIMTTLLAILAGTVYGLIIGIIPGAGATTGLVALFPFVGYFMSLGDPYLGIVFLMAVVAASTTGDTYTGVLLGIPGANSAAATMVDGFPLALRGRATYAITAAVVTSTFNGLLWGMLVFAFLPWYSQLIMVFGIPELWAFTMLALATVTFVSSRRWFRSIVALCIGLFLGSVGIDPNTASDRNTFGWDYLADGIQLMPLVAGLFAVPELIEGLRSRGATQIKNTNNLKQTRLGVLAVWRHRWLALRGGVIGAFIGVLPGLGGAMADWMAYGQAVATTPNPRIPFGRGNIRGVIGPEGANNAQKATSMLPTVLFGIPGAPFAALLMALFMYLGFEMGSPSVAEDLRFFDSLFIGFMAATLLVGVLCLILTKYIARIAQVPYYYYFPVLLAFIVWSCVQYTGGWEDYAILGLTAVLGLLCKRYKFSRPALLIGFILLERVESLTLQISVLYNFNSLLDRPIFLSILAATAIILIWGIFYNRNRINYS